MIIFLALLPAYILSFFYRSCLSVIANPLMADLGIGPREFGFLGSAWFFAFALAQFPIGWALDRFGPRWTLTVAMAIGTAGGVLFSAAAGIGVAVLALTLIGIGCAPVLMAAMFLFARTQPPTRFASLSSIFIGLGSLGNILGAAPLAISAEQFGWRPAMLAVAAAFALAALLAAVLLRDPPRAQQADRADGVISGLAQILRLRPLWLLAPLTLTGYAIIATARGLWIAPFMAQIHGFDAIAAGHAATGMALAMVGGAFLYGGLDKAMGRPKRLVLAGTLATAAGFALLALAGHGSAVGAIVLFSLVGASGLTYAILMSHARLFIPPHLTGRGMTALNFLFIGGAGLAQSGSGWLIATQRAAGLDAAATFANLHWVFAGVLLVSAAIYALTPEKATG